MIQRVQTVYLALVALFSILGLCMPIGQYLAGDLQVASFNHFVFGPDTNSVTCVGVSYAPIALGVLLIFVLLLSLLSIMLFRFRMRQLRLTIFSTLLLFGYVGLYAFLAWKFSFACNGYADIFFRPTWAAILPVLSVILNMLAIHGIRKDEMLVRSLDRLR